MNVTSLDILRVGSILWQSSRGTFTLTVVCKATFRLAPDECSLHSEQEPLNETDKYWDDDPSGSLFAPTDLAPYKPRADIMLVGSAFAPGQRPVRSLVARLVVGAIEKELEVFGPRAWTQAGRLVEGPGFTTMPLRYEGASAGAGNPVGMRPDAPPDDHGNVAIPSLVPAGLGPPSRGSRIEPVGFGPIAPLWPKRIELLGREGGSFSPVMWHQRPLPEDIDPGYFQAAPRDQQLDRMRGDERIELEHLHPEHARLATKLPACRPRAFVDRPGAPPKELDVRCDALWIDTDRSLLTLTWRGQCPLENRAQPGRVLVALEEPGQHITWAAVERVSSVLIASMNVNVSQTMWLNDEIKTKPALPFVTPAQEDPLGGGRPAIGGPQSAMGAAEPRGPIAPPPLAPPLVTPPLVTPPLVTPPLVTPPLIGADSFAAVEPPIRPAAESGPERAGRRRMGSDAPDRKSAAAFSDAAAGARSEKPLSSAAPASTPARAERREAVELLWVDAAAAAKIRKHPEWKKLLPSGKQPPRDDEEDASPEKRKEAKDRIDVLSVVRSAPSLSAAELRQAMRKAIEGGVFTPPLVVVSGELELVFDEVEILRATLLAVSPFMAADKRLKDAVDWAKEVLQTPGFDGAGAIADGVTAKVKEAFGETRRALPATYVDVQVERLLLTQRHYQKRSLLGDDWIRTLLHVDGAGGGIPTYLPVGLSKRLPMARKLQVRTINDLLRREDFQESEPLSLRVYALCAVVEDHFAPLA